MKWFTSRVKRFGHWVRSRPKKIAIPVTVVVLIVISIVSWQVVRFYSYMEDDPKFCNSCHIMEKSWDRWASSEHKDVGCHSCHQQSLIAGAQLILSFAFGDFERVEEHAVVPDDACEKCHESGDSNWVQVAATAGHKVHAEEQNIACIKCHSITLHRFHPPGPICSVCHEDKHVEIGGMALMHCDTCHSFLVAEGPLLPHRESCLECHQALTELGVNWPADAPMQYPCGDCHQPHQQASPIVNCLSCHTVEGFHLKGAHSGYSCLPCHQPHEWRVTQRETCLACHPDKTEHNTGFLCNVCHSFPAH